MLIAANRDEFFSRPALGLHFWEDKPGILAGRDELAGGSWLGINRQGRIAGVTNVRAPHLRQAGARSRGELVSRWLEGVDTRTVFETFLNDRYSEYNPFNLLYGDVRGLSLYSSVSPVPAPLEEGFVSISNGPPSESWPKMSRGVRMLQDHVGQALDPGRLVELMKDNARTDRSALAATGIPMDYEEALSSIFVDAVEMNGRTYGTRTTSVLAYDGSGIEFTEYEHTENGETGEKRHHQVVL